MGKELAVAKQRSVLAALAARVAPDMDPVKLNEIIKATCMPARVDVSDEQYMAFILTAQTYGLNPVTKEIYAYPKDGGGGIQAVVGIDGWLRIANEHPQFDGLQIDEIDDDDGNIKTAIATIWRKDKTHPIIIPEHLEECSVERAKPGPWQKKPRRMLRHKATIQALRYAFGFAGIMDPDEAEGIIDVEVERVPPRANQADLKHRIEAAGITINEARQYFEITHDSRVIETATKDEAAALVKWAQDEGSKRAKEALENAGN